MLTIAEKIEDIQAGTGEIRAGGTDLHDRYRVGISAGPIADIHKLPGLKTIEQNNSSTTIGALVTIDTVGRDPFIVENYSGLAQAANGLATPQIRWAATIGGNLLQRTRCWYYRHPDLPCTKKGDASCGGRDGHHPNGVLFDHGGCAHPHPSTLAVALLAYDATIKTSTREISVAALYGDGAEHARDHLLADGEVLTHIILPAPRSGERTAYFRSISRFEAEWPIVECMVRLAVDDGHISAAGIGVGGVSQIPMRLTNVEAALVGNPATQQTLDEAAQRSIEGANPLPQAAWKLDMLVGTVLEALEQALAQ